ncbi:DUF899 family protein [Tersicoccus sp. MR15.9]|uniref:DUF899 family protein n=1 Tax=Tersicoccus mangrovi TaxID=3121635 RepID=UPI002FE5155D
MTTTAPALPEIVDRDTWEQRRQDHLEREKAWTRLGDEVSAARRRLPMTPMPAYTFDGPDGPVTLLELFAGRRQLIVQNFMFDPAWDAGCPSCSNLADNVPHLAHFGPYDIAWARISAAPVEKLTAYSRRMGWTVPWVSSGNSGYNRDWGWTRDDGEYPGVSFYVRDGQDVYLTFATEGRGVEPLSALAGYLDRTVWGRQKDWEDSPPGWPQTESFMRNRRHDEYDGAGEPGGQATR